MDKEAIAAVSTAPGRGAIGVVRVSGSGVYAIARAITGIRLGVKRARKCKFLSADGDVLDEGIAVFFAGPASYTGEDVLELQGHGGTAVVRSVLARCIELGARSARPGEFTERAFINGKLDLAQAEAVADLISSSTAAGARLAAQSLRGALSHEVRQLVERLVSVRAGVEAALDFSEEGGNWDAPAAQGEVLKLLGATERLVCRLRHGERARHGVKVVIAGLPNAGKSSLLNALAMGEVAIVAPSPGTTRDIVRADVEIDGVVVHLADTAGLRVAADAVEMDGVTRGRLAMEEADVVLWVYDGVKGLSPGELRDIPDGVRRLVVRTKVDLLQEFAELDDVGREGTISVSAVTGFGLEVLRSRLISVEQGLEGEEVGILGRERHVDALVRAAGALRMGLFNLDSEGMPEVLAHCLLEAQMAFGEITGTVTTEDLLEKIFATFCVGK